MIGYVQFALLTVVVLLVGAAGCQALFGPGPRAERALRVLRIALAPAVLSALLGLSPTEEISEWVAALLGSLFELIESAGADE